MVTLATVYRQPNKIMAYLTFHKWLVSVCNIHNNIWMEQTKTSHLGKVSYAIILLGWRYATICRNQLAETMVAQASCKSKSSNWLSKDIVAKVQRKGKKTIRITNNLKILYCKKSKTNRLWTTYTKTCFGVTKGSDRLLPQYYQGGIWHSYPVYENLI